MYEMTPMVADRPKRSRRFVVTVLCLSLLALGGLAFVLLSGGVADAAGSCGGG